MSAATARVDPRMSTRPVPETTPGRERRHLEIAPTRAQRRARPRLLLAVSTMVGIVVILLAQLGLSIAVADGAYTISSLQVQQRDLGRQNEALAEQLESLQSPQFLAINAESLGMVASGSLPYIDLATGGILGKSTKAGGSMLDGTGDVSNVTIEGLGIVRPPESDLQLGYSGTPIIGGDAESATPTTAGGIVLDPGVHVVGAESSGVPAGGSSASPVSSGAGTLPSPSVP